MGCVPVGIQDGALACTDLVSKMQDPWPLTGLLPTTVPAPPYLLEVCQSAAATSDRNKNPQTAFLSAAIAGPCRLDSVVRTGRLDRPRRDSPLRQLPAVLASTSAQADAKS
jgi:hypothetical protein